MIRPLLLILALVSAFASGDGMQKWLEKRSHLGDDRVLLSIIEIAHCTDLVGIVAVTKDGVEHPFVNVDQDDVNALESQLPKGNSGRMIVLHGCDTKT